MKLIYKDHHRDQQNVVLIHSRSMYISRLKNKKTIPLRVYKMRSL